MRIAVMPGAGFTVVDWDAWLFPELDSALGVDTDAVFVMIVVLVTTGALA
jgi:hypothetical protein